LAADRFLGALATLNAESGRIGFQQRRRANRCGALGSAGNRLWCNDRDCWCAHGCSGALL